MYIYVATHIEIVKLESGLHWSHNTWGMRYRGKVYNCAECSSLQVHQCTKCTDHITLGARDTIGQVYDPSGGISVAGAAH